MVYWSAEKLAENRWVFTWTSGSSQTWDLYLIGRKIATVEGGEYIYDQGGYEEDAPPLEIVEEGAQADSVRYTPFVYLQWREVDGEAGYLIEKLVGSTWTKVGNLTRTGRGFHVFRTQALEDDTETEFRIFATNSQGEVGEPLEFTARVVRNPAPPVVVYEIDSTGDLVVGEA